MESHNMHFTKESSVKCDRRTWAKEVLLPVGVESEFCNNLYQEVLTRSIGERPGLPLFPGRVGGAATL